MAKKDPKVGTGKKPKGSGRRLYTDENPKDTVGIKFATPTDARKTVAKVKKVSKPFARKIQILTVGEQRAKVMGKSKVAAIFKKGKDHQDHPLQVYLLNHHHFHYYLSYYCFDRHQNHHLRNPENLFSPLLFF